MTADQKEPVAPRYGLAVVAAEEGLDVVPWEATAAGTLQLISEAQLQEAAPELLAVLAMCQAERKVQRAINELPSKLRPAASTFVKIMAMFGQLDDLAVLRSASIDVVNDTGAR